MRHQRKRHRMGRGRAHREATLAALSTALIEHKQITTTLPKAKALRVYVEPIINRAKEDTTHNRRQAFRRLRSKEAVKELFGEVADAVGDRPGGYTRIVKLGQRGGDSAQLALIELVDFGAEAPEGGGSSRRRRTRRGGGRGRRRRGGGSQQTEAAATQAPTAATVQTTEQPLPTEGVETAVVEEPAAEAQQVPIPQRTEPHAEAREIAEEQATEPAATQPEAEVPAAEAPDQPEAEATTAEASEQPEAATEEPASDEPAADEPQEDSASDEEKAS